MQVSHTHISLETVLLNTSCSAFLSQLTPASAKVKAPKPAKEVSPRRAVTLALDAMCAAFDKWKVEELEACAEEIKAFHAGQVDDITLEELEAWQADVAKGGRWAFATFSNDYPETMKAYTKASDALKASKQDKKVGGAR